MLDLSLLGCGVKWKLEFKVLFPALPFSSTDLQDKLSKKDKEVSSLVSQMDTLRAQVSGKSHWWSIWKYFGGVCIGKIMRCQNCIPSE